MATFGSLFSGIGGLDLGLERAGWECRWQVELDEWRRGILERHWPGVPRYADVRFVGRGVVGRNGHAPTEEPGRGDAVYGALDPVDLICGGFPCQDVSVAGRRAGLAGARSGLFHEFARIADAVRPEWLLIENVPGLLTSNGGRDFGVILGTLADLGYGVAWRILDSRFFGVPQRRRRVFIVGALPGGHLGAERAGEVLAVGTRCDRHPAKGAAPRPGVAGTLGANAEGGGWSPEPGEGVVGRTLKAGGNDRGAADHMTYVTHSLTSEGHDASEDGTGRGTPLWVTPSGYNGSDADAEEARSREILHRLRQEAGEKAFGEWAVGIATALQPTTVLQPRVHEGGVPGKAEETDGDMGRVAPQGATAETSGAVRVLREAGCPRRSPSEPRSQRQLVDELAAHLSELPPPRASGTLLSALWGTSQGLGSLRQALSEVQEVGRPEPDEAQSALAAGVRRLTTTETCRLQGFPDDWLGEPNEPPDSRRYAAMGDAVTVNVAQWLGTRLKERA